MLKVAQPCISQFLRRSATLGRPLPPIRARRSRTNWEYNRLICDSSGDATRRGAERDARRWLSHVRGKHWIYRVFDIPESINAREGARVLRDTVDATASCARSRGADARGRARNLVTSVPSRLCSAYLRTLANCLTNAKPWKAPICSVLFCSFERCLWNTQN